MAYQVAKEIGAASTVLSGNVEAIILTGELAYQKKLTNEITKEWIGLPMSISIPVKMIYWHWQKAHYEYYVVKKKRKSIQKEIRKTTSHKDIYPNKRQRY